MNAQPYDQTNSTNPWLINTNAADQISIDGQKLSAEYIWSLNCDDRTKLVDQVFKYFRSAGFPYEVEDSEQFKKDYESLCHYDLASVVNEDGQLKNSSTTGLDITRYFCPEFYKVKTEKGRSVVEVFESDELLMKVLKNRMGWCSSEEDGTKRPYIFGITPQMIIQGIRSCGLSKSISQFKIPVAAWVCVRYCINDVVLDYSAGWGARMLGACSRGFKYYGIDPATAPGLNKMAEYFKLDAKVVKSGSELKKAYKELNGKAGLVFSSPPYFNLEVYSDSKDQCYNKFPEYNSWLLSYWRPTVVNCLENLEDGGYFALAMVDKYTGYNLKANMLKICEDAGLRYITTHEMQTSKSHLSSKRQSKENIKFNDGIVVLQKV